MIAANTRIKGLAVLAAVLLGNLNAEAQREIPQGVKATAEQKAGTSKINKWVIDGQRNQYVAVLSNGAVVEIDLGGKWIRTSENIPESRLPKAVSDALAPYLGRGYEADNFVFVQEADTARFYTIDLTGDDDDATLFVSPQGNVIKKESR